MSVSAPEKARAKHRAREQFHLDVGFTKAPQATAAEDGSGDLILSGYASTWVMDRDGEMVAPDAFAKSLADYLQKNPIVLWQHDIHATIGQVTKGQVDATGLYVTVRIPNPGPDSADWQKGAYTSIKMGIVRTFSIGGYMTRDVEMGPDGPVFSIVDVELFEISCVSIPANGDSLFETMVKSFNGQSIASFTEKAASQLDQILGVETITDPELMLMSPEGHAKRYELLSDLFAAAYNGARPPEMDALKRIREAQEAGASMRTVVEAKLEFVKALKQPVLVGVDEKAGRAISAANKTKLQSALDAHEQMSDSLITAAESMKEAAAAHATATKCVKDVMGITDEEDQIDGGDDEADEPPNSPVKPSPKAASEEDEKALPTCPKCGTKITNPAKGCPNDDCDYTVPKSLPASFVEQKQLMSDISRRLRELGQERYSTQNPGMAQNYGYVYVDDIDMDRGVVIYCGYNLDGDGDDDYYEVPFMRGADGSISLGDGETEVQPTSGYSPKGLDFLDSKGVLSVPSASFAPRDTSWDASAARQAIAKWAGVGDDGAAKPNAKYKQAFLWQDGDGSTFGDIKYPVCTVIGGELKCVLAAVTAAAGRANSNNLSALKAPLTTLYRRAAKQFNDEEIEPPWESDSDD